jgi:hypothetical protein
MFNLFNYKIVKKYSLEFTPAALNCVLCSYTGHAALRVVQACATLFDMILSCNKALLSNY